MNSKIRWGIIGTGNIARQFAVGLEALSDAELAAVGSRAKDTANAFGDLFHVPKRYASYQSLAADPDVDVVYVATPHNLHKENTLMCLNAGKSVLCEKPFAINASEAMEMIRLARERRLFLMEAMWTRFFPLMSRLRDMLRGGFIGELRMLMADFGYRVSMDPTNRSLNLKFGGGGMLDVGIYPLSLAYWLFGKPKRITGMATLGETGVDEQSAVILGFGNGGIAIIASAARTETPQVADVLGTKGRIFIHSPWWRPDALTLSIQGKSEEVIKIPFEGNGYSYEAAEVGRCIREGRVESETMSLDETLSIMKTMDEIRAQWGLKYPME